MWIIYKKSDRQIIGVTALGPKDADKNVALAEVVKGSVKPGKLSEYDALQVTDISLARRYMEAFPHRLRVVGDASKPRLVVRDPESFSLFLESDAEDKHPVDGIPEIAADGTSSTLLTITKIDERFTPQKGDGDNEELYLRTDHGIIRDEKGETDINKVKLLQGQARIRLVSEKLKRVATLQVMSVSSHLHEASIRIEFI
ncbi:MAG TPA: hypothetical protein PKD12_02250 [Nitrospira sp.]|nr:hypothetical protein [Nitrospira sp.]